MTIAVINKAIRAMCKEVKAHKSFMNCWQTMPEEDLLYEVTVCIFSSQNLFEAALAMADRLRKQNLLQAMIYNKNTEELKRSLTDALSRPLLIEDKEGKPRLIMPRFKNRQAYLLTMTAKKTYGHSLTISEILHSACRAQTVRAILIQNVLGFGPKQASLFLRRVGYSIDLAVLDIHILDYLQLVCGLTPSPHKLSRLSFYENIEDIFRKIAADFGYPLGCVDLAIWLTMRVAKKEAFL